MGLRNFFRMLAMSAVIGVAGCGGGGGSNSGGGTPPPATTFTIVASAGTGGSISPVGTTTLTSGASQSYIIKVNAGYTIQNVLVDGVSVGAVSNYTFSNVTANHTIAASFSTSSPPPATTFTIVASAGIGGSISPVGTTTLTSGASQSYTITPQNGFTIQNVLVDGVSVGAVPTYTFSNVIAFHTISASFAPSTFTVTLAASKNIALNDNNDTVNLSATISPAVPNGTAVAFTAPSGTTISNVTLTSGNVATAVARSTTHASVSITASSAGANGSVIVKFIPQPASADVFIALDSAITKLDSLNLKFVNDAGATYSSAASLNQLLADTGSLLTAGPGVSDPANTITIGVASAAGFSTVANTPIIQLTYTGITSGIPGFRVASVVSASTFPSVPLTLSTSNFVVTVIYKDSGGNSL
ncbi:hypothetical protein [Geobacter sp. AOG1]|uniref:hypothetical protein n=1 Tax=Geobacter sp. AOG1 TaxID=1566346 RepID=UPI001CC66524|nr:hypothetical protein [Geobacter sp. AOG1]GFE58744.1 hypothetical protein AOG1_26240 [Geobacter sp. AOG1]